MHCTKRMVSTDGQTYRRPVAWANKVCPNVTIILVVSSRHEDSNLHQHLHRQLTQHLAQATRIKKRNEMKTCGTIKYIPPKIDYLSHIVHCTVARGKC